MSRARAIRIALAALAILTGAGRAALAQRPPVRVPTPTRPVTPAPRDTITRRVRPDTTRLPGDTVVAASDTAAKANLVEPDSVMRRLMALPGYDARVYQAETLTFDALTRGLCLANRATIASGDTLLVKSQSICSAGAGNRIQVGADSGGGRSVVKLPGAQAIYSTAASTYDLNSRRAVVNQVSTSLEQSGETLAIKAERGVMVLPPRDSMPADSASVNRVATFYLRDGSITACTDSVPDYHFQAGEIKRTGSFVVARPAVLYIGDVPVMWLPFLFQDVRGGRHSGILAPNVGVSDIVRNSPSYRRSVEGLGYYVAISDYIDAQAYLDWRSSAGQDDLGGDAGYMRYTGELRYNWIERYVNGRVALAQTTQGGAKNTSISVDHRQEFTRNASLNATYQYVTNTQLQRQTTLNPFAVSSTIRSSANYAQKVGPFSFTLGGQQTQYPGRTQLERGFPSFNMSTSPLDIGSWLVWTPSLTYSSQSTLRIDQASAAGLFLRAGQTPAGVDSIFGDTLRRNSYSSALSFSTPLQIFGYQLGNSFNVSSRRADFLQREDVTDVVTGVVDTRFYTQTYETTADWTPAFSIPGLGHNRFNLTPSVSLANIDPSPMAIRNHRTNGEWVTQGKRPTFGLSASPTLFGLFGGFGPYSRLRHSLSPTLTYSYAPPGKVSNRFLAATGRTKFSTTTQDTTGYLGGLAQNALTFGLSTNVEGKRRSSNDSTPEAGDKVKLVSVNFTPLSYDFERARATGRAIRGLTTERFGYTVRSELLPNFDIGVDYSLFKGSTLSDSALFSPYREGITANFSFSNTSNPFAVFNRLFGRAVPVTQAVTNTPNPAPDDRYARQVASQPVAGRSASRGAFLPTTTDGWKATFAFTSQRRRPIEGANVVENDPGPACLAQFPGVRLQPFYEQCVIQGRATPLPPNTVGSGLAGATVYRMQDVTSLNSSVDFNLTEHWSAAYNTNYDFVLRSFASQVVSLQRDLHDWRAIFAFTQSQNGAFAFNFLVSLKAEPELKFDYHKSTYRGASGF